MKLIRRDRSESMDYAFYLSYVMLSIRMNNPDLTEKFISDFTCKLNPQKQENLCAFAKGLLNYARKNYSTAIENISRIKGVDYSL